MPIQWPPVDRGIPFAPDCDVRAFAPAWDITNLGGVGVEFGTDGFDLDIDSLDPGLGIDNNTSTRVVNLRNPGNQFEPADLYTMAPPAQMMTINYGRQSYQQTDWYASNTAITGVTRDSAGAVLSSAQVNLFLTGGDIWQAGQVSDASGNFSFKNPGTGPFYIVAYKTGSPDVAGTTTNTLLPTLI